jgi:HAMP domain-containing protein
MLKEIKIKKTRGFKSLTVTLSAIFLFLTLTILLTISSSETYLSFKIQQKAIAKQEQLIAEGSAGSVKSFIEKKANLLEAGAKLRCSTSPEQIRPSLEKLLSLDLSFRQLVLFDRQQEEVLRVSRVSRTISGKLMQFDKNEAFSELSGQEIYVSPVYLDKTTNEPMVVVAVSVKDVLGDLEGALAAEVNLKFMWDLVAGLKVGKEGFVYVVDSEGRLIAFRDISRVLREENLASFDKVSEVVTGKVITKRNLIASSKGILGTEVVSDYALLGTPDWAVVVELPITEAYAGIIYQLEITVVIIIFIILFGSILSIYFSRAITRPIIILRNVAAEISKGKLDARAEIKSQDEIGALADSLNLMFRDLKKSRSELEWYAKNLEVKIKARTNALEMKNVEQTKINDKLEQTNKLMVGRELRMIELKKEIEELKKKQNGRNKDKKIFSNNG